MAAKPQKVTVEDRACLGRGVGKEIISFNLRELFCEKGAIQADFNLSFGQYRMPMGVELLSVC